MHTSVTVFLISVVSTWHFASTLAYLALLLSSSRRLFNARFGLSLLQTFVCTFLHITVSPVLTVMPSPSWFHPTNSLCRHMCARVGGRACVVFRGRGPNPRANTVQGVCPAQRKVRESNKKQIIDAAASIYRCGHLLIDAAHLLIHDRIH